MSTVKECAICSGPLTYAHLGVNCCRACAVFYKRTIASKSELKCKTGDEECMQPNSKATCRLCRFTKIDEILKNASQSPLEIISNLTDAQSNTSPFITHECFFDTEPSTSSTPLLDRLRKGYSLMCLIRYGAELGTRTKVDKRLEIPVNNLVLVPSTYSTFPIHGKTCKEAMKAFASYAFEDFRKLDEDSKEFLIKKSHSALKALDVAYRSMHHFPDDNDMRTPGYTTYLRPQQIELYLADCTDDVDIAKVSKELRNTLKNHANGARGYFKQVKPTDYEFVALYGLSLWNDEISTLPEKWQDTGMNYREQIMKELHSYYAQRGIVDYATRIGHLHSILVSYQDYVVSLQEDYELCRLMNMYKDYLDKNGDEDFC